jgi:hypothetical protein
MIQGVGSLAAQALQWMQDLEWDDYLFIIEVSAAVVTAYVSYLIYQLTRRPPGASTPSDGAPMC